ncbi:MAG: hypothetical protein IH606_14755 [Burkholderiales bacterium]|nr:hypothetical protein [Burkholderiales bacterium]
MNFGLITHALDGDVLDAPARRSRCSGGRIRWREVGKNLRRQRLRLGRDALHLYYPVLRIWQGRHRHNDAPAVASAARGKRCRFGECDGQGTVGIRVGQCKFRNQIRIWCAPCVFAGFGIPRRAKRRLRIDVQRGPKIHGRVSKIMQRGREADGYFGFFAQAPYVDVVDRLRMRRASRDYRG